MRLLRLGFGYLPGLDRLGRNPHALYFTAGEFDADALYVRAEFAPGVLNQRCTDTTTLLGETFTDDATAFYGALACDCADTCHGNYLVEN